jgi:hypothetical protein
MYRLIRRLYRLTFYFYHKNCNLNTLKLKCIKILRFKFMKSLISEEWFSK